MTGQQLTLAGLREQIDTLDEQLQALLNRRAGLAQQVAEVKLAEARAQGLDAVQFYRPEREAQVLRMVQQRNQGPLPDEAVARIFREIMSSCLALEKPLTVAYLGPEGTFTHAAAIKHFGHAVLARPVSSIDQVFADVQSGEALYGVVPVENSTEGMVNHTLDSFMQSALKICGEVELPIHLHLLVNKNSSAGQVTRICAHQQALAQSRSWLDRHWPGVEREAVSSNAKAARMAAEDSSVAAIAGDMAVELYDLVRLSENIQDISRNTTRFLIIGTEEVGPSGDDKTSIIVSTHNRPGALYQLLAPFHRESVMLTRIDTRPSRTENWAYVFFIEFEGHQSDERIRRILAELQEQSVMLKILGSYPKAVI
ncbi:MAG TPA: prephenate dehydratase [Pseudomonadales bacterium]